jgi:hypothetical protein
LLERKGITQVNAPEVTDVPQVLHVIVGHGLATYFLNAVRSVRATSPGDHVLVIDNASPDPELRDELKRIADADELIDIIFRSENDVRQNGKVGSLYTAYEIAFDQAIARGFDLLHLIQGDFQMLWWDSELVTKVRAERHRPVPPRPLASLGYAVRPDRTPARPAIPGRGA